MKILLKNLQWREFFLSSVFEINSTSSSIDKNNLINKKGTIPYITRTDKNNGYDCLVCEQDKKYVLDSKNVITVGLDTQTVFYQPLPFYTGQNIQVLSNANLNRHNAMFIVPLLRRLMEKFNWGGNGATLTRLKRSKILLPIDKNGQPDYEFMKAFIQDKERSLLNQYKNYISYNVGNLNHFSCIVGNNVLKPLSEKNWQEFKIGNLFVLKPGKSKGLNHLSESVKGVNYLGATNQNNGVLCQVEVDEKLTQKGNCIAFIRNGEGSMGYSVYKAEDFIATSDMSLGYNRYLNRYNGTFITTVADRVRGKYNFGYKRSGTRLAKESLLLPTDENGNPDYEYMEQYMRHLEQKNILQYLDYLDRQNAS